MTTPTETVYCVKYALSAGIFKLTGHVTAQGYFSEERAKYPRIFLGRDGWRRTWEEAVTAAEQLKAKKIASLEKQAAKLRKLTFTEVDRP